MQRIIEKHKSLCTTNKRWQPIQKWMTQGLLQSRSTLSKLRVKSILRSTQKNVERYKEYRLNYQRTIRAAKSRYYEAQLQVHSQNGKRVWQIINEITERKCKTESNFPASLTTSKVQHRSPEQIANALNDHFVNMHKKLSLDLSPD